MDTLLIKVFPEFYKYSYEFKEFKTWKYKDPHIILYRGEMDANKYKEIINSDRYIRNCIEWRGLTYENMRDNRYPFSVRDIDWWKPVYNSKPDLVGHYDSYSNKFTNCKESRQYKYAFAYLNGYCYLIIESNNI